MTSTSQISSVLSKTFDDSNAVLVCIKMKGYLTVAILIITIQFIYGKNCHSCGKNEAVDLCGRNCEPRCKLRDFSAVQCLACTEKDRGCRCKQPFLRDEETGLCVSAEDCSTCDVGEIRQACGRTCEGTCQEPYLPEICTRIKCAKQGCRCDLDAGYVRDSESGRCVLKRDCPICAKIY